MQFHSALTRLPRLWSTFKSEMHLRNPNTIIQIVAQGDSSISAMRIKGSNSHAGKKA
jgi:hypothetical protein